MRLRVSCGAENFTIGMRIISDQAHLAHTTVTALFATLTQMIGAGVFSAGNANVAGIFSADRTREREDFHVDFALSDGYLFVFFEDACLLSSARQLCASSSATLKFCSVLVVRSRR
jgi:hypothetical protein